MDSSLVPVILIDGLLNTIFKEFGLQLCWHSAFEEWYYVDTSVCGLPVE
jgi:hypothetical protein